MGDSSANGLSHANMANAQTPISPSADNAYYATRLAELSQAHDFQALLSVCREIVARPTLSNAIRAAAHVILACGLDDRVLNAREGVELYQLMRWAEPHNLVLEQNLTDAMLVRDDAVAAEAVEVGARDRERRGTEHVQADDSDETSDGFQDTGSPRGHHLSVGPLSSPLRLDEDTESEAQSAGEQDVDEYEDDGDDENDEDYESSRSVCITEFPARLVLTLIVCCYSTQTSSSDRYRFR